MAETALHRLADEQAALRRVATAVAAEHESARLFALVSEEVGRLLEARTAHMFRFDSDGQAGTIVGGWAVNREHVLPVGTRMPLDGDTATTRVWRTGRPARMDTYDQAEGELAATLRGYGVQAVVAAPVFLGGVAVGRGDRLHAGPASRSPRTPSSGSPTSPSSPPRRWPTPRRARSWPPRAPASSPPATPSAGGWSATCTTARSSAWSRWR